jgi:predicted transposase YdaD
MKYVTAIERMAETRGEARGRKSMILKILNYRFGEVSPVLIEKMDQLSIAQLESLGEALFDFETIADLTHWLENSPA